MPAGPDLIERIAALLKPDQGIFLIDLQKALPKPPTRRAIRYAVTALVAQNRARRGPLRNPGGHPVFAVAPPSTDNQIVADDPGAPQTADDRAKAAEWFRDAVARPE